MVGAALLATVLAILMYFLQRYYALHSRVIPNRTESRAGGQVLTEVEGPHLALERAPPPTGRGEGRGSNGAVGVARSAARTGGGQSGHRNGDTGTKQSPPKLTHSKPGHNCAANHSTGHRCSTKHGAGHSSAANHTKGHSSTLTNQKKDGRGPHRLSSHSIDSAGSGSSGSSSKSRTFVDSCHTNPVRCSSAGTTVSARDVHLNSDLT